MHARKDKSAERSPLRLLIWTAVAGLIFGVIGFGEIAEDTLRSARNSLHPHQASGEIVLVKIDDASLGQVGRWPWPRRYHADLTDALTDAGAKRIFFDFDFIGLSNPVDDRRLSESFERSGRVVLPVRSRTGPADGSARFVTSDDMFTRHAERGTISAPYNYQNAVWWLPYGTSLPDGAAPSFAAMMAGRGGPADKLFMLDYSVDPASIPALSLVDVLDGKFDPKLVRGRDVIIGPSSDVLGDVYFIPGTGQMGGAYIQIIGAETLKAGTPRYFGWLPLFIAALAVVSLALYRRSPAQQALLLTASAMVLLVGPAALEAHLIYLDITPALFVIATVGVVLTRRIFRQRGLVNEVSGLPNLNALRASRAGRSKALIAARILNYAEAVATLPPEGERQLIEQIVARLSVGAPNRVLYQGDGGIFAWFEEPRRPFGNHIEALYALFRNPARVGKQPIDLSISFGVEIGSSRSLANRLASALVAAEEAAHDGLKWKYHDPETLQAASWKLSMLSQLDAAVEKGEVWVAYQPKLELATRRIVGAEALARWTHPEKGPIAASEFIAAAEQHDRIAKLTDFVLDQAIASAASLNRRQAGFGMAVNLSARLLNDKGFTLRLAAMLARHGLPAERLTLELTETATLADNGSSFEMLGRLRELGVGISIDDYGTGLSTLDYLKKIPAAEIKIDQSFVKGMTDNRSDRLMVQSTIALAHSLGRKVVAEGVERRDTLEVLTEMECDIAQGFVIGRPMSLESLARRIGSARKSRVA